MIIGIVRHFPVKYKFPCFCNSRDFNMGMSRYDQSDVVIRADNGTKIVAEDWDACFSSKLKRAIITAEYFVGVTVIQTSLLNEVPLSASFNIPFKIPVFLWAIFGRLLWYLNSKKPLEIRRDSYIRAGQFLSQICCKDNNSRKVLLFTHGFYTNALKKVLKRMGFKYTPFLKMKHARLYLFKK